MGGLPAHAWASSHICSHMFSYLLNVIVPPILSMLYHRRMCVRVICLELAAYIIRWPFGDASSAAGSGDPPLEPEHVSIAYLLSRSHRGKAGQPGLRALVQYIRKALQGMVRLVPCCGRTAI